MRPRTIVTAALLAGLTLAPRCATRSGYSASEMTMEPTAPAALAPAIPASAPAPSPPPPDEFRKAVYPILSARCGECHDPGGRMYARLPFDDPKTITSHSAGVLRRLKGDDRAAVEKWLAGLAPALPAQ
jgi:hypothetical protein